MCHEHVNNQIKYSVISLSAMIMPMLASKMLSLGASPNTCVSRCAECIIGSIFFSFANFGRVSSKTVADSVLVYLSAARPLCICSTVWLLMLRAVSSIKNIRVCVGFFSAPILLLLLNLLFAPMANETRASLCLLPSRSLYVRQPHSFSTLFQWLLLCRSSLFRQFINLFFLFDYSRKW